MATDARVGHQFLDAQNLPCLAAYLEQLHAKGMANVDHTTLLLNCYTKLKDGAKLDEFIQVGDWLSSSHGGDGSTISSFPAQHRIAIRHRHSDSCVSTS